MTDRDDYKRDLRSANIARQKEWDAFDQLTLAYRGNELAGEVGEACNVIKKLERERLGIAGSRDTVAHLAEELADVIICTDLIAMQAGIDLDAAVIAKFNASSEKVGLKTRLRAASVKADEVVAVKPLEWESCFPRAWFAATDFETYRIYETDDGATCFLTGGTERLHVADLTAAKAAAQADYEARIKSALVEMPAEKGEPEPVAAGDTLSVPFNPCLAKLRAGEPFFVLLGRDKQAPLSVLAWAHAREIAEGSSPWVDEAREVAATMAAYSGVDVASLPADAGMREALDRLQAWCDDQGALLGAVDGYGYHSGQEAAYRHVAIEIGRRINALLAYTAPTPQIGEVGELARLKQGIRDIAQACVDGRVCDDVAWFTEIPAETLFDKCCNLLGEDLPTRQSAITAPGATKSDGASRPCTCHPDDNPPEPCPQKFALSECVEATKPSDPSPTRSDVTALTKRLDQVLKVMRGARNRSEPMAVWADDIKAVEDVRALLETHEIRRK